MLKEFRINGKHVNGGDCVLLYSIFTGLLAVVIKRIFFYWKFSTRIVTWKLKSKNKRTKKIHQLGSSQILLSVLSGPENLKSPGKKNS